MPAYEVQGSIGLQLNLQTHIPGTLSVVYNSGEDEMLAPGRTCSQPIGESSPGTLFGRRTQSELSLDIPMPVYVPTPEADNVAPDQSTSAPSPAPTEIIPADLTQEEIVEDITRSGFKVRDFAFEDSVPVEQRAPELFDPVLAWDFYETALEKSDSRNPLNGRHLSRLVGLGWVSEEVDGERWLPKDREALEEFDSRPHYPWKAFKLTQPEKEELRDVATARFQWVNTDQLPQFVNRGRLAAVSRRSRSHQKRPPADGSTESDQEPEPSPRSKKRRLSTGEKPPVDSQPPPIQHDTPLSLVNGKPPQQSPAGQPSDTFLSPSHPPTAPSQPGLSRSLQRQLSIASVSSPRPSDLSRLDSRTTLTQGASQE
ncbi:hypothetical protein PAXRUDRAFT_827061 [Paxillus rubicundulus Ve08.2h10]|uniref:Uncharacterized protein n=1 Tax=Paxillus rubicundulus Ve08.2h10 TaxID=930991 RepID=A0A0D0E3G5_9AGAM|nr:hypothetical protein PAXRUDRAFT_827061 [Paxillus rubicundulus Ve08.2h10]